MQYLPTPDLARLFRAAYEAKTATSQRDHMAMLCGFFTGARIDQIKNIHGTDIFQRDGKWVIKIRAAKHGLVVTHNLHISDDPTQDMSPLIAIAQVKRLSLVFDTLHRSNFNVALKRYAEVAGVPEEYAHSHIFRHSAAMAVYDATKRIGAVSQFLAHRSPSSAFVYLQENDGMLAQDAMDNLVLA